MDTDKWWFLEVAAILAIRCRDPALLYAIAAIIERENKVVQDGGVIGARNARLH